MEHFTCADILSILSDWQQFQDCGLSLSLACHEIDPTAVEVADANRVGEEFDYLLMTGLVVGDDRQYKLSDKWWELDDSEREEWCKGGGRPRLVDPRPLANDNPRNHTRARYEWEDNLWTTFEFALVTAWGARPRQTAIVSGLYLNPSLDVVEPYKVRLRLIEAVAAWQQQSAQGEDFMRSLGGDFALADLKGQIHPDLSAALATVGIAALNIRAFDILSGDWYYNLELKDS